VESSAAARRITSGENDPSAAATNDHTTRDFLLDNIPRRAETLRTVLTRSLVKDMRVVQLCCQSLLRRPLRGSSDDVRSTEGAHVYRLPPAVLLLFSLVALPPLASADPSDPTWLLGIYDEADGDSVVWLIESMALRIHPQAVIEGKPDSNLDRPLRAAEALPPPSTSRPAIISLIASPSRAPPLCECDGVPSPLPVSLLGTPKPVRAVQVFDRSHAKHNDGKARVDPRSALAALVPATPRL
jgi:hypothetical protein